MTFAFARMVPQLLRPPATVRFHRRHFERRGQIGYQFSFGRLQWQEHLAVSGFVFIVRRTGEFLFGFLFWLSLRLLRCFHRLVRAPMMWPEVQLRGFVSEGKMRLAALSLVRTVRILAVGTVDPRIFAIRFLASVEDPYPRRLSIFPKMQAVRCLVVQKPRSERG